MRWNQSKLRFVSGCGNVSLFTHRENPVILAQSLLMDWKRRTSDVGRGHGQYQLPTHALSSCPAPPLWYNYRVRLWNEEWKHICWSLRTPLKTRARNSTSEQIYTEILAFLQFSQFPKLEQFLSHHRTMIEVAYHYNIIRNVCLPYHLLSRQTLSDELLCEATTLLPLCKHQPRGADTEEEET